jgi:metal-dependent hydrolase (beta-lactamase superfamily II)
MFRLEMLPAANGDALLVSFGDNGDVHRVLIDGGTPGSYKAAKKRLQQLAPANGPLHIDLLVISHIDDDHIGGILGLLEKQEIDVTFGDVWFNGYGHLIESELEPFGPVQGERLTTVLLEQGHPWNNAVGWKPIRVTQGQKLPVIEVPGPGGLSLTILSPDAEKLAKLKPVWEKVCREQGLDPNSSTGELGDVDQPDIEAFGPIDLENLASQPFHEDTAEANGSSIAFLAEYENKRVLFAADAHPTRLNRSIDELVGSGEKLRLDACKLSHHGSDHNTSPDLIDRLDCTRYLISTNGSKFRHPHQIAMARVIMHGSRDKELIFNYRTEFTEIWDDQDLQNEGRYTVTYPDGDDGVVVDV